MGERTFWWGDKKLVGWGESNKGHFFGEEMNKVLASKGGKGRGGGGESKEEVPSHPLQQGKLCLFLTY